MCWDGIYEGQMEDARRREEEAAAAGNAKVTAEAEALPKELPKQVVRVIELDVVELNRHIQSNSDSLFYLCINNQPKLERETLDLIIKAVAESTHMKHLSLCMLGITDTKIIELADAIAANKKLETLNLDSNIIGMPGIEALMKVVSTHPSLREIKLSNENQSFDGKGEEMIAAALEKNQNILKVWYSFKQGKSRKKADRAILRNNEVIRQKRRMKNITNEEVYDIKAVRKIRDPWPQPWMKEIEKELQ